MNLMKNIKYDNSERRKFLNMALQRNTGKQNL